MSRTTIEELISQMDTIPFCLLVQGFQDVIMGYLIGMVY